MSHTASVPRIETETPDTCSACGLQTRRRLLSFEALVEYLALAQVEVRSLIVRREVPTIRIKGQERYDLRDADALIAIYKNTALRRAR